nr:prepilin peptidase [Bifidobacterium callimiconis]
MTYLFIPTAVAGFVVTCTDIRTRRVPRAVIAAGSLTQVICMVAWCATAGRWSSLIMSLVLALACAAVQLLLAMVRPGTLGFGDVTCTLMMGIAVGWFGVEAVLVWWILMGLLGLVMLGVQKRRGGDSIPFAPAIVLAAVIVVLVHAL